MNEVISEYLLNHTLEEVTKDWEEIRRLSDRTHYDGWIHYIINTRVEDVVSDIIWIECCTYVLKDEEFRVSLLSGNEECFSKLKEQVFNNILNDSKYLNKIYTIGNKKEKQEKFKQDRSKFYL